MVQMLSTKRLLVVLYPALSTSSANSLPVRGTPIFFKICVRTSRNDIWGGLAPGAGADARFETALPLAVFVGSALAVICWTGDLVGPTFGAVSLADGVRM